MAELSAWRSRAGRAWPELAAVAAGREVVTYKELGERIGAHWRQIGRILEPIQAHCLANGLPPITILIVGASSGLPGDGFVAAGKEQVEAETHRVWDFPWADQANPFQKDLFNATARGLPEGEHVSEGSIFATRKELNQAGLHRPLQAGIATADNLAESIVVSGGYADDEDHGDVIIYTGQGGQDSAGKQVADQELTRGNLALAGSCNAGLPIRVIRGAKGDPKYSPKAGYRYDGLWYVESFWDEPGKAGFRILRFKLVKGDQAPVEQLAKAAAPAPAGVQAPPRVAITSSRVVRSTQVTDWVKSEHKMVCQFCGEIILTPAGPYAEGCHIKPLGRPHEGDDTVENVLCLCPNCHVRFDKGALVVLSNLDVIDTVQDQVVHELSLKSWHNVDRAMLEWHRNHHTS